MAITFLRLTEVKKRIGYASDAAVWYLQNPNTPRYDPTFPKPVKIGKRAVAWVESEIDAWQQEKIAERELEEA